MDLHDGFVSLGIAGIEAVDLHDSLVLEAGVADAVIFQCVVPNPKICAVVVHKQDMATTEPERLAGQLLFAAARQDDLVATDDR